MNLRYLGLPVRTGRMLATALGLVGLVVALLYIVDPTVGLSFGERCAALALGVLAGTLCGLLIQYSLHLPITRRVLVPAGSLGAIVFLLGAASQSAEVFDHGTFVVATILRAVIFTASLRLLIDAALGPLSDVPPWAMPLKEPVMVPTAAPEPDVLPLATAHRRPSGSHRVLARDDAAVNAGLGKKIG